MNENTELVCARVKEMIDTLCELAASLAGCKEPSLLSQVVNENTELVCAHVQEVIDILCELPSCETEKVKMREGSGWKKMVATGGNFSCIRDEVVGLVVLAMLSVIMEGDANSIVNAPRLQGTLKKVEKVEKVKKEKVNKTDRKDDSGSDSSWFVRDAGESIEEADAELVSGDGI